MKVIIAIVILLKTINLSGQTEQYQKLINSAINRHGAIIVFSKPINKLELDKRKMWEYFFYFENDFKKLELDTIMFSQIIENSKQLDTTLWLDNELRSFIVIKNKDEFISKKKALQKLQITDRVLIRQYKKQIKYNNSTDSYKKNIYYFSRPVFNNSKEYAVIQWDNGHNGLGGGGAIDLYYWDGKVWGKVGTIVSWNY